MFAKFLVLTILVAGCQWTPVIHSYPSGLKIIRADQATLDKICSHVSDEGKAIKHAVGCYDKSNDIVYVLNNSTGAQAIPHELAHREGIEKPSQAGYDW